MKVKAVFLLLFFEDVDHVDDYDVELVVGKMSFVCPEVLKSELYSSISFSKMLHGRRRHCRFAFTGIDLHESKTKFCSQECISAKESAFSK